MKKIKIIDATIMDYVYEQNSWLYWKKLYSNKCRQQIGSLAGYLNKPDGYYIVRINGENYVNHRILFQLYHNVILKETDVIDHINGIKTDNKKENLRLCTNSQNNMNIKVHKDNKLGIKNICIQKTKNYEYYDLCIKNYGKKFRKYFRTDKFSLDDVIKIRDIKLLELHGEYMNNGGI